MRPARAASATLAFDAAATLARVAEYGDLYADSLTKQQSLPAL